MHTDQFSRAEWAPPVEPPPVPLAVDDERGRPSAWVRALEVLFLGGLAGVFLVNAVVAVVQPSDFTSLVDKSLLARSLGFSGARWIAPVICVNDAIVGVGVLAAIWARHSVRNVILAWAGLWFFVITAVKVTALDVFP